MANRRKDDLARVLLYFIQPGGESPNTETLSHGALQIAQARRRSHR